MKTTNKLCASRLFISDGDAGPVELLRLSFKSGGANLYLPHSIVRFLNLDPETKSLIAFLDDTGSYNFLVVTSDKDLAEMLKPLILQKRMNAERLRQQVSKQLQIECQQATEAKQEAVSIDI